MKSRIKSFTTAIITTLLFLSSVLGVSAASLSIRLESPESPTNDKNFRLGFVVLDIEDRPVSVTCFIKKPSEGSFSQFDSTKSLASGGNSGYCNVTDSQISPVGTYEFKVEAKAGGDTATSNTVSVNYDNSRPNQPTNYSREKIADCKYKLTFKTADDGKTTKVEIYRSESAQFDLNNGTRIGEVALGPNQQGEYTDTVPNCDQTYYYALRSFDSASNTSDPIGDAGITTTSTTTTTASPTLGAIPVSGTGTGGTGTTGQGSILGESDEATDSADTMEPETTPEDASPGAIQGMMDQVTETMKEGNNKIFIGLGLIIVAVLGYAFLRRSQK